jgi:hypothetical protein
MRTLGLALLAALALCSTATAAQPGIMILDGENNQLTVFHKLKCKVVKPSGEGKVFKADGTSAEGWKLSIVAKKFSGFHEYEIPWLLGTPSFLVDNPGPGNYGNIYEPPDPHPDIGGALAFPGGKKVLGLGFITAFNPTITDGVAVGGQATCKYPRRR